MYAERYLDRWQPHHANSASIHRLFRQSGELRRPGGDDPRIARTVSNEDVLQSTPSGRKPIYECSCNYTSDEIFKDDGTPTPSSTLNTYNAYRV